MVWAPDFVGETHTVMHRGIWALQRIRQNSILHLARTPDDTLPITLQPQHLCARRLAPRAGRITLPHIPLSPGLPRTPALALSPSAPNSSSPAAITVTTTAPAPAPVQSPPPPPPLTPRPLLPPPLPGREPPHQRPHALDLTLVQQARPPPLPDRTPVHPRPQAVLEGLPHHAAAGGDQRRRHRAPLALGRQDVVRDQGAAVRAARELAVQAVPQAVAGELVAGLDEERGDGGGGGGGGGEEDGAAHEVGGAGPVVEGVREADAGEGFGDAEAQDVRFGEEDAGVGRGQAGFGRALGEEAGEVAGGEVQAVGVEEGVEGQGAEGVGCSGEAEEVGGVEVG